MNLWRITVKPFALKTARAEKFIHSFIRASVRSAGHCKVFALVFTTYSISN